MFWPTSVSVMKDEEMFTSLPVSEFVSDAFDSCKINQDDLRREMKQLVLDEQGWSFLLNSGIM